MLALPIAFLSLVPSGTVGKALLDVIQVVAGAFPFRPALDALAGALSALGPEPSACRLLHLALLTVGLSALLRAPGAAALRLARSGRTRPRGAGEPP